VLIIKSTSDEHFMRTLNMAARRFPGASITILMHAETAVELVERLSERGTYDYVHFPFPRRVRFSKERLQEADLLGGARYDDMVVPVAGPTLAGYDNVKEIVAWIQPAKVYYHYISGRVRIDDLASDSRGKKKTSDGESVVPRSQPRLELAWASPLLFCDGYGRAAQNFMIALDGIGVTVRHIGVCYVHHEDLHPRMVQILADSKKVDKAHRVLFYTPEFFARHRGIRNVGFTMFETTEIPRGWDRLINRYVERLVVPTRWNRDVFARCGVRVPIDVVPLGIEPDEWPLIERSVDRPFTFFVSGLLHRRKGADIALEAFRRAFPLSADVRLVLKTRDGVRDPDLILDDRTTLIDQRFSHAELLQLLGQVDCFVFPTRGEGFGLPPLEALATGCSVIVTNGGSTGEILNPAFMMGIELSGWSPCSYGDTGPAHPGQWMEPSIESCAARMREAYEDRDQVMARAAEGSVWVKEQYSATQGARQLVACLSQIGFFG
jgi:glycosyltransferase involved in cell wall biosynthesis